MYLFLIMLCWAATALTQPAFDPLRVDDGRGAIHFYPAIYRTDAGNPYVIWANQAPEFVGAYGQEVALNGSLIGENVVYQQVYLGTAQCPPALTLVELSGGGGAELIMHN